MFLKSKGFSFRPISLLFDLRSLSFLTSSKIPCDNLFFWIFCFGKCGRIFGYQTLNDLFFFFHPYLKTTVIYQDFFLSSRLHHSFGHNLQTWARLVNCCIPRSQRSSHRPTFWNRLGIIGHLISRQEPMNQRTVNIINDYIPQCFLTH